MAIADELIAILGFKIEGEDQARRFEDRLNKLNKSLGNFVASAARLSGIAAGAMAAGFGLLGRSVIETSAQFETFQATLETIEGSAEAARAALDWIAEFGKTTPYNVEQVTAAFVKLKAYGIDPIANETLRILGDTASAMGKTLDQAVEAFADASTGEFERLKEFGIKARTEGDNVTFSWTRNGEEMTRTVKKNATEIRAFLLETMGDRFAGAMDRQSRTFRGITSNIGDSWTDFQRRIGEAGFFENVTSKLQGLLDTINRLDEEGKLDEWAQGLSNALSWTADAIWAVTSRIAENLSFLADNWEHLQTPVMVVLALFGLLIARAFPLMTVLLVLGLVVDDMLAYMQGGESIIGDFITQIQELTGVSEGVAQAIAGISGAIVGITAALFLFNPIGFIGNVLKGAFLLVVKDIPRLIAFLGRFLFMGLVWLAPRILAGLAAAFGLVSNPVGWAIIIGTVAAGLIWYFWDDLVALWAQLEPMVIDLWSQMSDWILSIDWGAIGVGLMSAIWDGMKSIGEQITAWFTSLIPDWAKGWFQGDVPSPGSGGGGWGGDLPPPGSTPGGFTPFPGTTQSDEEMLRNLQNYLDQVDGTSAAVDATLSDYRQDNRNQSITAQTTVNQTVTQASDAPAAAAEATGNAVNQAVAGQRSQIETEPSF